MTTYILKGFVLTGLDPPSFLIPFFIVDGSNAFFVQDLNRDYLITSFQRFNPKHYEQIDFSPSPIPRMVGEEGVLAVQTQTGRILYGDPTTLRQELGEHYSPDGAASFFDFEVIMFLYNQVEQLTDAIA